MLRALRTTLAVLVVAGAVVALAVFLTAPVYRLLLEWGWIDDDEFLKVTRRLLLIPGVLALFLWLKPWRDGGPESYGLLGERARPRVFVGAYVATLAVGLGLLVWHFSAGWLCWEDPLNYSGGLARLGRWLVVGFCLALVEEWFFRGWMDRRLRRQRSPVWSVVIVAVVYAGIHAFKPSRLDVEVTEDAAGVVQALGWWLANLVDVRGFGPTFVGLALLSLVLSAAWHRTRTLWASVGIHAAGITLLRSYGGFTDRPEEAGIWVGSKELVDGPVTWILLLVLLRLLWPWGRERQQG